MRNVYIYKQSAKVRWAIVRNMYVYKQQAKVRHDKSARIALLPIALLQVNHIYIYVYMYILLQGFSIENW